jgi:hypothetical protein
MFSFNSDTFLSFRSYDILALCVCYLLHVYDNDNQLTWYYN